MLFSKYVKVFESNQRFPQDNKQCLYANIMCLGAPVLVSDTASENVDWKKRELGVLMLNRCKVGMSWLLLTYRAWPGQRCQSST
jgi:hypothetical protein